MNLSEQLNCFMAETELDYAICGGHAIDLFIGAKTRPHKDLDVVIFWEDRDKIIQYMLDNDWAVYEPCGTPYLQKINNIANQIRVKSNIWCIKPSNYHYKCTEHEKDMFAINFDDSEQTDLGYIEFLFNTKTDGYFLYSRNYDVKRKLNEAVFHVDNIPCLAPEMVHNKHRKSCVYDEILDIIKRQGMPITRNYSMHFLAVFMSYYITK